MKVIVVKEIKRDRRNNVHVANRIMDLRDERIRIQRKIAILEDKKFYEPEFFTHNEEMRLELYRKEVAEIKAKEDQYRLMMVI